MSRSGMLASTSQAPHRRLGRRRWIRRLAFASCGILVLVLLLGAALYVGTPSVNDATARVRALELRHGAVHPGAPVPRRFAEAIVASEDSRFYAEPGVDPVGIVRAAWLSVADSGVDGGGSTISQQLAKVLYTGGLSGLGRDAEQVALAIKLNIRYSKSRILQMYAASVYFGHGFYGLHNASCGYCGRLPRSLSLSQASLLAGLVQAPSAYDPLHHLGLARARERYVVGRLVADGKISRDRAQRTMQAPLGLATSARSRTCAPHTPAA